VSALRWRSALRATDPPAARLGFSEADATTLAAAVDADREDIFFV
jgi:hypothetical protein